MVRYTIRAKMGCAVDDQPSPLPQPITAAPEQAPTSQSRTYASVNPDASDLGTTLSPTPRTIPISFHHQPHCLPQRRPSIRPSTPPPPKKQENTKPKSPAMLAIPSLQKLPKNARHSSELRSSVPPSHNHFIYARLPPMNEQMLRLFRPRNTPAAKGRKLPNAFHPLPLFLSHRGRGQAQGT